MITIVRGDEEGVVRHEEHRRAIGILAAILSLTACDNRVTTRHILPSGREIDVISSSFTSDKPPTWVIAYRTSIPIEKRDKLEAGLMELWPGIHK